MTITASPAADVTAQVQEIVTNGVDIRPRVADVVARSAQATQPSAGGLVAVLRAAVDGAREGLARSVPADRDSTLRQVVDALGDGLAQAALAGQLALQEAAGTSRTYADVDLARFRDDLTAARDLFEETIDHGLSAGKAFTAGQVAAARTHARTVADRFGPAVAQALDAVRRHPAAFARESVQAGVGAGQAAAGALFQALGGMLHRAGYQLRQTDEPKQLAATR